MCCVIPRLMKLAQYVFVFCLGLLVGCGDSGSPPVTGSDPVLQAHEGTESFKVSTSWVEYPEGAVAFQMVSPLQFTLFRCGRVHQELEDCKSISKSNGENLYNIRDLMRILRSPRTEGSWIDIAEPLFDITLVGGIVVGAKIMGLSWWLAPVSLVTHLFIIKPMVRKHLDSDKPSEHVEQVEDVRDFVLDRLVGIGPDHYYYSDSGFGEKLETFSEMLEIAEIAAELAL